jgi:hypothetical protein
MMKTTGERLGSNGDNHGVYVEFRIFSTHIRMIRCKILKCLEEARFLIIALHHGHKQKSGTLPDVPMF